MDDAVPEAERADVAQVLEECTRHQDQSTNHHVGSGIDVAPGEGPHQEVPAQNHVEDAGHQQLNHLRSEDNVGAKILAKTGLRNLLVAVPYFDRIGVTSLVGLVKAFNENLAGVTTNMSNAHHGQDTPVP